MAWRLGSCPLTRYFEYLSQKATASAGVLPLAAVTSPQACLMAWSPPAAAARAPSPPASCT
eukprot:9937268-Alexandrium_andersonii.AAC.1